MTKQEEQMEDEALEAEKRAADEYGKYFLHAKLILNICRNIFLGKFEFKHKFIHKGESRISKKRTPARNEFLALVKQMYTRYCRPLKAMDEVENITGMGKGYEVDLPLPPIHLSP